MSGECGRGDSNLWFELPTPPPAEACMADPLCFAIKRWFEEDDTALRRILGDIASDEEVASWLCVCR